ncbi:uncharacterized protein [Watersipora subatra]|uniref:uncharacterized protein isoform X1 n=1 Tax=Watersipora subatra TaxID=2589382 RepID=UPI00355C9DFC
MITITEAIYEDGAIVRHPIIVLSGTVSKQHTDYIVVSNETFNTSHIWPLISGRFKALVHLCSGSNQLLFRHGFYTKRLYFKLIVPQTPYIVQPIYITSKDGDGRFQAPPGVDNSPSSALERISLGAALLQTFTAVNLTSHGFQSQTFQMPIDQDSWLPVCKVFRSKLTTKELFGLSEKELWRNLARELMESTIPERYTTKFLGFFADSRYNGTGWKSSWRHADVIAATKGHAALGGGGLALLSTCTLHTWADSIDKLVKCLTDDTNMDVTKFMDDSAYRSTYWANYSTGLGAALHELGHTFDLSHTQTGIMSRGFDNMHKFFVMDNAYPVSAEREREANKLELLKCQIALLSSQANSKPFVSSNTSTCSLVKNLSFNSTSLANTELSSLSAGLTQASPSTVLKAATASFWSKESALMLSTSRWFMPADEQPSKSHRVKPNLTSDGNLQTRHGLRVVQLYSKCLDRIVYSEAVTPRTHDQPSNFTSSKDSYHKTSCDRHQCSVLHLRDVYGQLHTIDI